jgi:hypothetical protein
MKPTHLFALGVFLASVVATSPTAAQKPAPPQPTEQQKLKDRVDTLESQLKEAQGKADRAAMEKDYIERIQKEVNAYYEKAFNTQLATITIIALIVGLIGKFGVDHIVQSKLTEASTTLREGFRKELADELQTLKGSNAAQLKQLEDELVNRIALLEKDTYIRSDFQFQFNQALASDADERYGDARHSYRRALSVYKSGQARDLFKKTAAKQTLANLFYSFEEEDNVNYVANAKEELARDVYNGLEDELARTALQLTWLAPLVRDRKAGAPAPLPATPDAVPPTPQKSPEPTPDNAQPAKPEQGENK